MSKNKDCVRKGFLTRRRMVMYTRGTPPLAVGTPYFPVAAPAVDGRRPRLPQFITHS